MANVVHLSRWIRKPHEARPVQLELFSDETKSAGVAAYFDVTTHNQNDLLSVLARKSVRVVIDLRMSKALPRSKYNHAEVFDYIFRAGMTYIEMDDIISDLNNYSPILVRSQDFSKNNRRGFRNILDAGPCLAIYNGIYDNQNLESFRRLIGKTFLTVKGASVGG